MKWLIRGLIQGLVIGAVLGTLFSVLDRGHHMMWTKLLLGACVGCAVAISVGKPLWKDLSRGLLKAVVGCAVGAVAVGVAYWIEPTGFFVTRWTSGYFTVASLLGGVWGALVALDEKC